MLLSSEERCFLFHNNFLSGKSSFLFQTISSCISKLNFQNLIRKLNRAWEASQKRKCVAGRPYRIGGLREHLLLLLVYYRTYTTHLFLAQIFHVDETTICRVIQRIAPLAEQVLKIKSQRILKEKDLEFLIVDATEQCIERPKNQRDYYFGKKHAHTIKTEVVGKNTPAHSSGLQWFYGR